MNNYKQLKIWQKAVDLAVKVYELTRDFPKEELYGLTSQLRRCSISIASNIAEGAGRNSKRDFRNFLGISHGSSCELATQLLIAFRTNLIDQSVFKDFQGDIDEVQKMNWALKRTLTTND
jgi:four helix bundle protein